MPCRSVGLHNHGNTCYINATVQILYATLAFREALLGCEPSELPDLPPSCIVAVVLPLLTTPALGFVL